MAPIDTGGTALATAAVTQAERQSARRAVGDLIREQFPDLRYASIGFYWPFRGEIDLRYLVRDFLAQGAEAALPVVVEKRRPLEFRASRPLLGRRPQRRRIRLCVAAVPHARNRRVLP